MKFLISAILSLLWLPFFSQQDSESFQVTGIVHDSETHAPLQFVSLTLQDYTTKEIVGDITSKNGGFSIIVPNGKYNFIAESLSFKPFIINLLTVNQDLELGVIELTQNVEELNEIEVLAKNKLLDYSFDKKIYNASKDIANVGGNAVTVLENTPTVRIDERGNISVRGNAVSLLVDGKPFGAQSSSADVLSLIPANSISKVEIMTRSAKYDAQGGDVINIILKKRKNEGFNGSVELHGGLPDNHGASSYLSLKKDKINVFSTISFNHLVRKKEIQINQKFFNDTQIPSSSFDENRNDNQQKNSILLNVGVEFNINNKNTVVSSLLYTDTNMNYNSDLLLNDFEPINELKKSSFREVDDNTDGKNIEAYIDYTTKFNKENHQLSLLLKYDQDIANNQTFIHDTETFPNSDITNQKSNQNQGLHSYYFQIDYKLPLKNNSFFEAGQKTTCRTYSNDFNLGNLNEVTKTYDPIKYYDNEISYDERIYAFYINYSKQFNKLNLSLGLRTELSNTIIGKNLINMEYKSDYINYFPSAILSYTFDNSSSIMVQYTPYIDRPSIAQLNPYNSFTDVRYQQTGNPFLKPSYSNYFAIDYHKDFEKLFLNTAIYLVNTQDAIINTLEKTEYQTEDGFDIYRQYPINNGTYNYMGIELNLTYSPSKKLRLNAFAGPYYSELSNSKDKLYDYGNIVLYSTLSALYRLNNTFRFQANYTYQTPKKTAINELDKIQFLNIALSKDLFEGKSTLTFKINDVFHTREAAYNSQEANTLTNRNVIFNTQYLLSFTYRFSKASKTNTHNRSKETDSNVFEIEETMQ